jgi:hypothetical protein
MLIIIRNSTFKRYKNDLIIRNTINFSYNSNELKNNNSSNKIIIMEEDSKRKTTIISIYFSLKSKHSKAEYKEWIKIFIKSVSSPLVIFTDIISKDYILTIKPEIKEKTLFYIYEDAWQILRELEIERNRTYSEKYKHDQLDKDPEKHIHNSNLYAIWNIKPYITYKIATENPFNSSFFLFTDIGAFRSSIIPDWPDNDFIQSLCFKLDYRILFGQINDFNDNLNDQSDSFRTRDLMQAGFFLGTQIGIKNYKINYYNLHDEMLDKSMFVGKEQIIMNLYSFKAYKNQTVRLRTWNVNCFQSYDKWFFYQKFFALDKFYNCSDNKFSLLINL